MINDWQETNAGIFTHAGKEVGVASTKAFTAQITSNSHDGNDHRREKGLDVLTKSGILKAFRKIPDSIRLMVSDISKIKTLADTLAEYNHCFFLSPNIPGTYRS